MTFMAARCCGVPVRRFKIVPAEVLRSSTSASAGSTSGSRQYRDPISVASVWHCYCAGQQGSHGRRRSSLMGFIPPVKPARPNGVYLARHSRCHDRGPNRGSPLPLAQPAPLPTVGPEAVAAAGNYGQNIDAIRSVPRKWSATMQLDDALAVTIPQVINSLPSQEPTDCIVCALQSRSQIQSWDALSDSSLQRHRDWRSNRDGAGSPETLRHPHKHDERISAWMRASTPVNNELAMIQENRVSKPVPLSLRALTSLLPSSRNPKSGRAAAGQGWRRVHQPG